MSGDAVRVLIADDNEDMRSLVRVRACASKDELGRLTDPVEVGERRPGLARPD